MRAGSIPAGATISVEAMEENRRDGEMEDVGESGLKTEFGTAPSIRVIQRDRTTGKPLEWRDGPVTAWKDTRFELG